MFIRERYAASQEDILATIRQYPLATLVSQDARGFTANHLPLVIDPARGPHGTLIGHFTRQNPQHAALRADSRVMAVFNGPAGYVSSSWYSTGRDMAPTWNYAAVHCHGTLTLASSEEQTVAALRALLNHVEQNMPNAWRMEELGPDGLERRLPHIIGFEIAIERIEAKLQMSQYERPKDTAEAIDVLRAQGQEDLADTMQRCNFGQKHSQ
ncbi:negative transcriptional regulator [Candidatus Koribacter versatilis Ellin345]|uniref:Negative transcriptional regulator n=1 Tax=Koribacter versatilis (strain Ellin345) TaxID=204669 RepID=Q1IKF8_KORVE|nr:FMN-binding negative transcriptional regulator [Candidatus Koribacter versatilis]ABF42642.1 negative transcriptional regulator [Candidatus Koribacter versatilis Ellin345]